MFRAVHVPRSSSFQTEVNKHAATQLTLFIIFKFIPESFSLRRNLFATNFFFFLQHCTVTSSPPSPSRRVIPHNRYSWRRARPSSYLFSLSFSFARRDIFVPRVIGLRRRGILATGIGSLSFLRRRSLLTTYDLSAALARSARPIQPNARDHFGPVYLFLSRYLRYLLYQLASRT